MDMFKEREVSSYFHESDYKMLGLVYLTFRQAPFYFTSLNAHTLISVGTKKGEEFLFVCLFLCLLLFLR